MRFLANTIITNNSTGKSILKAFEIEAVSQEEALLKALNAHGGNESIFVKNVMPISDFSHKAN